MSSIYDWAVTPGPNATADAAIGWSEGQNPDTVNDSARQMMARVAQWRNDVAPTRTSTGTGNDYVVAAAAPDGSTYKTSELVSFVVDRENTGPCTININNRGAVAFRPAVGVDFKAGELRAGQPVNVSYHQPSNTFLGQNTGHHVNALTAGIASQSVAARLLKIGDPVLSLDASPAPGRIRLTEVPQELSKTAWPELSGWLATRSTPYPWGSTSTTFTLPPAAGYFLRFAALSTTVDPDGPRAAGLTQADTIKQHDHGFSGTTDPAGAHSHTYDSAVAVSGGSTGLFLARVGYGAVTSTAPDHAHTFSGTTANSGGAETRPKNVALHLDIVASNQVAESIYGHYGSPYRWSSATSGAVADGVIATNIPLGSLTVGANVIARLSETDGNAVSVAGLFDAMGTSAFLKVSKIGAPANVMYLAVVSSTDNGGYRTIPCTVAAIAGAFVDDDKLALEVMPRGGPGGPGPSGTVTAAGDGTAADPGIRFASAATGWFRETAAAALGMAVDGVARFKASSLGTFGLNSEPPATRSAGTVTIREPAGTTDADTRLTIANTAGNRAALTQSNANDHVTLAMGWTTVVPLGNRWGIGMSGSGIYALVVEHGGYPSPYHRNVGIHVDATPALHPFTIGNTAAPLVSGQMLGIYKNGPCYFTTRNNASEVELVFGDNGGSGAINVVTNHDLVASTNGIEALRIKNTGGVVLAGSLATKTFSPGYPSNRYLSGGFLSMITASTATLQANLIYLTPFRVMSPVAFTRIGFEVTTAVAGNARLGIFAVNSTMAGGTLVLDAGSVSTATTGIKEITINQTLEPGVYFLALLADNTSAVRSATLTPEAEGLFGVSAPGAGEHLFYKVQAYGGMPASISSMGYSAGHGPLQLWLRKV